MHNELYMKTFKELGLNADIMKSLDDLSFETPTQIQAKAIPFVLDSKKDLIALAQTGTGKTAAFSLPILNQIDTKEKGLQAIILCPTRELCMQITQDINKFAKYSKGVKVTAVYGGESIMMQIKSIKSKTNIVVGTPGRVRDLIRRKVLKLQSIKWVVLDEADEMLDMGFKEDLDAILQETPKTRQTLLFSATISNSVHSIAKKYMQEAEEISIGEKNQGSENVAHEYYVVHPKDRFEALKRILDYIPDVYGILFCRTKYETQEVADSLKQSNYNTEAMHGDISQNLRTKIMQRFKQKKIKLLVATDVAARGIDVNNLTHVINYNLPDQNESYTHRSGRTGRAQNLGIAITIITPREARRIKQLENMIGRTIEPKKVVNGQEILKNQITNFFKDLEVPVKDSYKEYFKDYAEQLEKLSKEDVINNLLHYKFNHLIEGTKNSRDLNAKEKNFSDGRANSNSINLKINIGKSNSFDIKSLFALINSNKSLKGVEIGKINLTPTYSIFSVEKSRANQVQKALQDTSFMGKTINISTSTELVSYGRSSGRANYRRQKPMRGNKQGASRRSFKR